MIAASVSGVLIAGVLRPMRAAAVGSARITLAVDTRGTV
jgi:hypothetical protein